MSSATTGRCHLAAAAHFCRMMLQQPRQVLLLQPLAFLHWSTTVHSVHCALHLQCMWSSSTSQPAPPQSCAGKEQHQQQQQLRSNQLLLHQHRPATTAVRVALLSSNLGLMAAQRTIYTCQVCDPQQGALHQQQQLWCCQCVRLQAINPARCTDSASLPRPCCHVVPLTMHSPLDLLAAVVPQSLMWPALTTHAQQYVGQNAEQLLNSCPYQSCACTWW